MILMDVRNALREDIAGQMKRISDELSSGRAADFGEYKRLVGVLQGLRKALDSVDTVFNKLLDDE